MDERLQFVARRLAGEPMAELCREFGISRCIAAPDAQFAKASGTFKDAEETPGNPWEHWVILGGVASMNVMRNLCTFCALFGLTFG
jgi:hypothetical protein